MAGEIGALSGRRAKLLILTMCKAGIVNIFMGNGTAAEGFPTAVADAGSPVEMSALLFDKRRTHLIIFNAGSAFCVTENNLTADIGLTAAESSSTKVMRVVEDPFGVHVIYPVEFDFFGDGSGSKMFLITWNDTGHNGTSCFCCLIINRRISYL